MPFLKGPKHGSRFQDLTGRVIGRLTVLRLHSKGDGKPTRWWCRCECGREKPMLAAHLKSGERKSCGCALRRSVYPAPVTIGQHGLHKTAEHQVWAGVVQRCYDPGVKCFSRYGGRGIKVCDRWLTFENFLADMGTRPFKGAQIDRIDNEGHYEPGNCRWATPKEQARNTRKNRLLTFRGETLCVAEWAERLGIGQTTLTKRIDVNGWSVDRALATPARPHKPYRKKNGVC